MLGEILSLETADKLARIDKTIDAINEEIEAIKEYDIDRPIYTGESIIDGLNVILEILEGNHE